MEFSALVALVVEVKPSVAALSVTPKDSLINDLGLDSLDLLQLGRKLQRSTGLPFVMQDWLQEENQRAGKQFTIESALAVLAQLHRGA